MISIDRLRAQEYPWTLRPDVAYLNHAATGPLPQRCLDQLQEWMALRAEPWRITLDRQFGILTTARAQAAQLIGAGADEIAMMVNTGYGVNFAARSLPLQPGDIVVGGDREFPANVYPWMALEKSRGVTLQLIPCQGRLADEDAMLRALDNRRVKVLAVSWVSFETGKRLNLARLGAACRERGITFVVDGIQGVGAAPLDVRACHVDILCCGAQKWLLSPWGTGFVYVRRELITQLEPTDVGWLAVRSSEDFGRFLDYRLDFFDDARRFEMVTLPFQDFAGMTGSLSLFLEVGLPHVFELVRARTDQIVDWAMRRSDIRLVTPSDPSERAGIVSLIPPDPAEACRRLEAAGVAHSLREGAIRLSPHFYTSAEEVDRALSLIAS
ncbi:MAG: aminotransferase class V-fold PLP-dependent enzyme [Gemmatimonadaceae bacterium]